MVKFDLMENISALGSLPFFLMIIAVLYSLNQVLFATQLLAGIFFCHIMTYLIRLVYYKERPRPQKHNSLIEKIDASSFPSLHSMRAMTFFVVSVTQIKSFTAYYVFGVYLVAVLYSRYHLKKHDALDILGGALIGIGIGSLVVLFIKNIF